VQRVRASDLRLQLDLRPSAPLLGALDAPLRLALAGIGTGAQASALPALSVSQAEIHLIQPGAETVIAADLELSASAPDGRSTGSLRLAAQDLRVGRFGSAAAQLELPFEVAASATAFTLRWSEPARGELVSSDARLRGAIALRSDRGHVELQQGGARALRADLDLALGLPAVDLGSGRIPASEWKVEWRGQEIRARGSALAGRVDATARVDLDTGKAHVALGPVAFAPGTLQPVELDPRLGALADVRGTIAAAAELRISSGELQASRGELTLGELAFRAGGAAVEGLAGVVHFASLAPLASEAAQSVRAAALELAGIRFARPELRFSLASGELQIDQARMSLGSGSIRVSGVKLGDGDAPREAVVEVADLELAELLALADLEGVAGTGRISGSIPLRIAGGDGFEVLAGVLESRGPGVLRVRSERVRSALASAGATVDQLVAALEDFQYEKLRLELHKPLRGTSTARLELLGHNPAVLEGRAFALNVNLETDLGPLLDALATALRISGEWFRAAH
jgi:hypothetical protein